MTTPLFSLVSSYADLRNQVVFITGGGSGIGAALTEGFLLQGAKVAFVSLSDASPFCDAMEKHCGQRPLFIPCDVRDIAALQESMAQAAAALGTITVLINNAARDDRHQLADWGPEQWDESLNTNLRPYFFTAQAALEGMKKRGRGTIINLSSNSFLLGLAEYPAYVTAKAGIMGLTKALARELGPFNIRVNCLFPGWVMTERQKKLWVTPDSLDACLAQQALKTTIEEVDMAEAALFLASSASRMMTGQALVVDGGRS